MYWEGPQKFVELLGQEKNPLWGILVFNQDHIDSGLTCGEFLLKRNSAWARDSKHIRTTETCDENGRNVQKIARSRVIQFMDEFVPIQVILGRGWSPLQPAAR